MSGGEAGIYCYIYNFTSANVRPQVRVTWPHITSLSWWTLHCLADFMETNCDVEGSSAGVSRSFHTKHSIVYNNLSHHSPVIWCQLGEEQLVMICLLNVIKNIRMMEIGEYWGARACRGWRGAACCCIVLADKESNLGSLSRGWAAWPLAPLCSRHSEQRHQQQPGTSQVSRNQINSRWVCFVRPGWWRQNQTSRIGFRTFYFTQPPHSCRASCRQILQYDD